jgi:2-oxoglutarate ferredoxin oxidoreductase subunit beta
MKRTNPDKIIFSYQGDGDLAAIGTGEIVHAAHRGEQITVIFINNAVFGMTGGQMAPTTTIGQVTATTTQGRQGCVQGYPLNVCEMLATLPGAVYIERCSLHGPAQVRTCKKAIKKAFELQVQGVQGMSLVEVLSPCPTGWRMSSPQAIKWIENEMVKTFPLGCVKDAVTKK